MEITAETTMNEAISALNKRGLFFYNGTLRNGVYRITVVDKQGSKSVGSAKELWEAMWFAALAAERVKSAHPLGRMR